LVHFSARLLRCRYSVPVHMSLFSPWCWPILPVTCFQPKICPDCPSETWKRTTDFLQLFVVCVRGEIPVQSNSPFKETNHRYVCFLSPSTTASRFETCRDGVMQFDVGFCTVHCRTCRESAIIYACPTSSRAFVTLTDLTTFIKRITHCSCAK